MTEFPNKKILTGDCLEKLKEINDNSIDLICTDPPYGYGFMNKDWDKAVISVDVWKECFRVLKHGSFTFVMSAPRQDVLSHMIVNLSKAGFKTDFTSIFWAYASGFPKAMNISKAIDKKLGFEREVIGKKTSGLGSGKSVGFSANDLADKETDITKPASPQAKKLDGSYAGFQPKPAVEVILVCMKPLSEKNYIEQALKDSKGITWLDDCRIPTDDIIESATSAGSNGLGCKIKGHEFNPDVRGRFPANLLVSDNALDEHSKYFDLDKWEAQFIITPKPSKSEKNDGLDKFVTKKVNDGRKTEIDNPFQRGETIRRNTHPTVKPVSLFKYLITMGSRPNDIVLDPFMGSGTTAVAAEMVARKWIGIELNPEYVEIIRARISSYENQTRFEDYNWSKDCGE